MAREPTSQKAGLPTEIGRSVTVPRPDLRNIWRAYVTFNLGFNERSWFVDDVLDLGYRP